MQQTAFSDGYSLIGRTSLRVGLAEVSRISVVNKPVVNMRPPNRAAGGASLDLNQRVLRESFHAAVRRNSGYRLGTGPSECRAEGPIHFGLRMPGSEAASSCDVLVREPESTAPMLSRVARPCGSNDHALTRTLSNRTRPGPAGAIRAATSFRASTTRFSHLSIDGTNAPASANRVPAGQG